MPQDKQLRGISLAEVVARRDLDQALNAKEFAVLAGVSYSAARARFRRPGFPVVCGVVFWQDFLKWRTSQAGLTDPRGEARVQHPAWLRRLVVLSFKAPQHDQHMGKMAELILKTESSGILNWLLEGRKKLLRDRMQLTMTPEQKGRAANLLMASQSPAVFIESCLEKKKDSEITAVDLYSHYQEWCQQNKIRPFASQAFTQMAREEIELGLGLRYRHDLGGEQGTSRGWKGVRLVEATTTENVENASAESAFSI